MKERPILFSGPMVHALLDGTKTQTRRTINVDRLRVKPRRDVQSDTLGIAELERTAVRALAGQSYPATMNPLGAVSACVDQTWLGMKPGEFDFVCPYADGATYLEHGAARWHIRPNAGQRLWVRETWQAVYDCPPLDCEPGAEGCAHRRAVYRADDEDALRGYVTTLDGDERPTVWRPSIFMSRWASRITLEICGVRIERLHAISEEDAQAEGASPMFLIDLADFVTGRPIPEGTHRIGFASLWKDINGAESWDANPWVWVVDFRRVDARAS